MIMMMEKEEDMMAKSDKVNGDDERRAWRLTHWCRDDAHAAACPQVRRRPRLQ
jgi:hypothetical protein